MFTYRLDREPATHAPKPEDAGVVQRVAGFEVSVQLESPWDACVNVVPGDYWYLVGNQGSVSTNPYDGLNDQQRRDVAQGLHDFDASPAGLGAVNCFVDDVNDGTRPQGTATIRCGFKAKSLDDYNKGLPEIDQTLPLAYVLIKPQPSLYSKIIANQDNGVVVQVLTYKCNLVDPQGHPIKNGGCGDADVTIRWLEGDVNGDCVVSDIDAQQVSFRVGARPGNLLYNRRYDLVDTGIDEINIKDVQFVYGRLGSKCHEQNQYHYKGPSQPPQTPVSPKG